MMSHFDGATGFIRPTFEEYPNRYKDKANIVFTPTNPGFTYTADDLINFFNANPVRNLVLINPDNPSGNYIPMQDVLRIIKWAKESGVRLIIDESFADFADERNNTLIRQSILDSSKDLYVIKSISKSYGVPGLRLGVMASGNTELISALKKDVSIWNINSFAEFYMQIEEKYKKDYERALENIRAERTRFQKALSRINGIKVFPSQANYVMVELVDGLSSKAITRELLTEKGIFVKDLAGKLGGKQYLRIAVRNSEDNDMLISALEQLSHC